MTGDLSFKRPNLMKLVFTEPADQAFAIDGQFLYIYIPELDVLLSQVLLEEIQASDNAVNLNTEAGLALMRQGYSISYAETYRTVALDTESPEQVYKLRLERRRSDEQFRVLELAVTEDLFIRRISGTTVGYDTVQLDFTEVRVNQGIADAFFTYDIPKEAYERRNFIYDPSQE